MTLLPTSVPTNFSTVAVYGDQNHMNVTGCDQEETADWIPIVLPVYILLIAVLGIMFNVFVLMVFCFHKKNCTVAEIYLGNLATADLLLVSCLPFWAVNISNNFNWPFGQFLCKVANVSVMMNVYCSIYFLVLVSIDRYVALAHPLSHDRSRRPKYAKLGCMLVWGLGFLLSIPSLIYREVIYSETCNITICKNNYNPDSNTEFLVFQGMLTVLGFIIPVSIISFCSVKIIQALRNQLVKQVNSQKTEEKATTLLLVVLVAFLICWVPFHLVTIVEMLEVAGVLSVDILVLDACVQIFSYFALFNSVLNPILYVIVGRNFRKKVKDIFMRLSNRETSSSMASTNPTMLRSVQPENVSSVPTNFSTVAVYGDQNHTNVTKCDEEETNEWILTVLPVYILLVTVLGIMFNVFVLMVFCFHKKACTVAEIYLSNLAAADLLLVSCLPFWAVTMLNNNDWPFGWFLCKVVDLSIMMNVYCSIYFLVLVSIDRYVALVHPLSQDRLRSSKYAKLGCVLVWGLGFLLGIPSAIYREISYNEACNITECNIPYNPNLYKELYVFQGMLTVLGFIIPGSIISFCSVKIIQALKNQLMKQLNSRKTEDKATTLLLVVLVAFLICWVPYHLVMIVGMLVVAGVLSVDIIILGVCIRIFSHFALLNSVLNPILYVIVGRNFRKKVREVFRQLSGGEASVSMASSH
ncbi:hypothetical protein L3Q82_026433 [Scortum barcoo]|uniref:Uncharacterized protein n=1 Tax=Scortum barcoo TaxID=214431 RepID=A0ACB8WIH6_9TELE|nr:hypothetical protein L3Q82_026433 [Scortum barcoo]